MNKQNIIAKVLKKLSIKKHAMVSVYVDPKGTVINTESNHLDWIVEKSPKSLVLKLPIKTQKIIEQIKKSKPANTVDWLLLKYKEIASEDIVWEFIEVSGYVRLFDDALFVPEKGLNKNQLYSLQDLINKPRIYINWRGEEFSVKKNDFQEANNFLDLVKNKEFGN